VPQWMFQLLAEANGVMSPVIILAVVFAAILVAVVAVALACKGERAANAVLVLRILMRARIPKE
jgi:hypothetical protein